MPDYYHNGLGLGSKVEHVASASCDRDNSIDVGSTGGGPAGSSRKLRSRIGWMMAVLASANLAACSQGPARYAGNLYQVESFAGGVVADEPRAALVGRDVIANGGNAADAMVAMYFTMAVTMPSSASLGGGGVCVAHQIGEKKKIVNNVVDFLPRAAAAGQVAVPGNVRGMAAVWAAFGKQPWAQLVAPAEALALQGTPVSRSLANNIATAGQVVRDDPQLAALFVEADGKLAVAGDNLRQPQLAAVLGQIRAQGAGAFYAGPLAQRIADAAQSIGAPLTTDDLRNFRASLTVPLQVPLGDQSVYLPQPPAAAGVSMAQMLQILQSASSDAVGQSAFLADATMRVMADRSNWMKPGGDSMTDAADLVSRNHTDQLMASYQSGRASNPAALTPPAEDKPENPWSVTAVALDQDGLAIACGFTMNALFGAARMTGDTGLILAPAPNSQGAGFSALAPVIVANQHNGQVYFAGAASGGMPGALSEAVIIFNTVAGKQSLDQAVEAPRVFHNGTPDKVFYEATADGSVLSGAGYQTEQRQPLGVVNAVVCPKGSPSNADICAMRNDYRGNGLSSLFSSH
jgi:gamma-glutamyltranspeptidase/glutathione hydrolase